MGCWVREGGGLLLGTKRSALLEVCARAEGGVDIAGKDQSSCRPIRSLFVYSIDLVGQLVEQLDRDCVAGLGTIEGEDLDAAAVRRGNVFDIDYGFPPGANGCAVEGSLDDEAVANCADTGFRYAHRGVVKPWIAEEGCGDGRAGHVPITCRSRASCLADSHRLPPGGYLRCELNTSLTEVPSR